MFLPHIIFLAPLLTAVLVSAISETDAGRVGTFYTSIPIYRTGAGTNVVSVGLGTPAVDVNLTLCE